MSKAHKKTDASLINIKQEKDKPLKNYLVRFNRAVLKIKDLPLTVTMHSILIDLKSSDFSKPWTINHWGRTRVDLIGGMEKRIDRLNYGSKTTYP